MWSLQGETPVGMAALRPLSPEWPAAASVLAVSETYAWVSEGSEVAIRKNTSRMHC